MKITHLIAVGSMLALTGLVGCSGSSTTATDADGLTTAASVSALAQGQQVNVRLGADPANLTALHVRIGGGRHAEGGHIRGAISAIDATAGTLTVFGSVVTTSTSTRYRGVNDLAGLAVGDAVDVAGTYGTSGIVAEHIDALGPAIGGTIDAITTDATTGNAVITVLGREIAVAADTEVVEQTAPAHDGMGPGGMGPGGMGGGEGMGGPGGGGRGGHHH